MVIAWIALHNWCTQSYIMYQLSTCEMCLKRIIQEGFSNHLRAKRKEMPVGQWWCHGRTGINHAYLTFPFFPHLKHILTARVPLGSQLPKVEKIKMSDVKRHITQKSYRTTLKCSEISCRELEFWGHCDILKIKLSVCTMLLRQKIMGRAQRIMWLL